MSTNLYLLLGSFGLSLFCLCLYLLLSMTSSKSQKISPSKSNLERLIQNFSVLTNSINVLREVSAQYFNTMQANGYGELCSIESTLGNAIELCQTLFKEKQNERAEQLIKYIYIQRGVGNPPQFIWGLLGEQTAHLENWGERVDGLLIHLTESVNATSNELKEIGGMNRRKRRNTVMMLNEARLALGNLNQ